MVEKLTSELFRRVCGQFATGIAIITARDEAGGPHGMTVNSFTSLSLEPPLVMAAIALSSYQLAVFEESPFFAINILTEDQRELSDRFARRGEHRFLDVPWEAGMDGAPLLKDVIATLECRRTAMVDAGDHRVLIGEVHRAIIHRAETKPLLYFRGRYHGIA